MFVPSKAETCARARTPQAGDPECHPQPSRRARWLPARMPSCSRVAVCAGLSRSSTYSAKSFALNLAWDVHGGSREPLCAVAACHCALHVDAGRWVATHRPNPHSSSVRSPVIGPKKICQDSARAHPPPHEGSGGRKKKDHCVRIDAPAAYSSGPGVKPPMRPPPGATRRTISTLIHDQEAPWGQVERSRDADCGVRCLPRTRDDVGGGVEIYIYIHTWCDLCWRAIKQHVRGGTVTVVSS
jgi:hypothetical protein